MPSLALLVHRVADLDEGGLLLVVAEAISRYISKYNLPDPFRLQVVVDLDGDVCDAGPGVEVGRSKILEELLYQSVPQDLNSKVPTTDLVPKGKM